MEKQRLNHTLPVQGEAKCDMRLSGVVNRDATRRAHSMCMPHAAMWMWKQTRRKRVAGRSG